MEINDEALRRAARELRIRLGLTQALLADKIGRTIASILRYETQVAPRGPALIPYAELAIANDFADLATLFRDAIIQENGPALEMVMNWHAEAPGPKADSKISDTDAGSAAVVAFLSSSNENRALVEGLCAFLSAKHLSPIEELARSTIKRVLLEQPREVKASGKKMAR